MGGQTRALVVEDHPLGRKLLVGQLEAAGYEVLVAEDGVEALDVLERERDAIDVILLDRLMPRMDGMEVLRRLKAHPDQSKIPVVMQTAADSREEIIEGIRAGAFYYLTKPFDPEVLLSITAAAVDDHVRYRRLRREIDRRAAGLGLMLSGDFRYRTVAEANDLAVTLAAACPDPGRRVVGLSELLINAVEHGNLGITYDEKHALIARKRWEREIEARLNAPEYRDKRVEVRFRRHDDRVEITIVDEGAGFDWQRYIELDPARAFDSHGRGIVLAKRVSFDEVHYRGRGNEVRAVIRLPRNPAAANEGLAGIGASVGLEIAAITEPRSGRGGDRVGARDLGAGRVALWTMDVSGHGKAVEDEADRLAAAFAELEVQPDSPAATLAEVSATFKKMLPTGRYATMLLGIVDVDKGAFTYAAATSPPPVVVTRDGGLRIGDGSGIPLGISATARYEDRALEFDPGELLFLHTDGIQSCGRSSGTPLKRDGVFALLPRLVEAADPAAELAQALKPYARPLEDDLTVLFCRRR